MLAPNDGLIAEFMGIRVDYYNDVLYMCDEEDGCIDAERPYWPSLDWNQLIPVVQKVFDADFDNHFDVWKHHCRKISSALAMVSKDGVYNGIIEYINWYNENSSNRTSSR
jgi:hypothetical protein